MDDSADVFGKLSRIFETHSPTRGGETTVMSGYMDGDLDEDALVERVFGDQKSRTSSPDRLSRPTTTTTRNAIPTPFEVWREKNKLSIASAEKNKPTKKLSGQQWDKLVDKMHHSNKIKQKYNYYHSNPKKQKQQHQNNDKRPERESCS